MLSLFMYPDLYVDQELKHPHPKKQCVFNAKPLVLFSASFASLQPLRLSLATCQYHDNITSHDTGMIVRGRKPLKERIDEDMPEEKFR